MQPKLSCFKAYDIRGKVPSELDEKLAFSIGRSYALTLKPKSIIVGYDIRLESVSLAEALIKGLNSEGVKVINIGLCGTEEVYFHTFNLQSQGIDGGIMITASHNPKGYNGLKLVREGSIPLSGDSGLMEIHDLTIKDQDIDHAPALNSPINSEMMIKQEDKKSYIDHLLSYINIKSLKPLKVVVNPGNGGAGQIIKLLEKHLPFEFIYLNETPDGNFPNGVPNPLLPENRAATALAVKEHNADLGIAWDGDFDRCFLFDETGAFIEGYYIVGLLSAAFLKKFPDEKIVHDPRLTWNTVDVVLQSGGVPIQSKTGHAFMKDRMRSENAIYGGEMSAHHYFRDFAYCDSGMIPWLLITELLSLSNQSLSEMVKERINAYPCSGELNYTVNNPKKIMETIVEHYGSQAKKIDYTDGVSIDFENWRFNLRSSNTEPLLRLNVESKADIKLVPHQVNEIEQIIHSVS